jgi:acyl-CoA thioester hydrolase
MSDWKKITVADVEMLRVNYQQRITESYLDDYKHMNVMWYTHLFSCALDDIFQRVGLTQEYFEANHTGTFALEGHVRYINEVRVGQQVSIRTRAIARSDRRFHFLHFMTNDDTANLSATLEAIGTHVDLKIRRSAPFPPQVAAAFDELLAEHARLPWPAPVCGAMKV